MTLAQKATPIDTKIATIKPRPSSRCLVTAADMNVSGRPRGGGVPRDGSVTPLCVCAPQSMYHERQGVAVVPPTVPGAYLGLPEKGTMRKQKSIGTMLVSVCGRGLVLDRPLSGMRFQR